MLRICAHLAAATVALTAWAVPPAVAAVVTLDSQERFIEAHITLVYGGGPPMGGVDHGDRVERAADFGPFSKSAHLSVLSSTREPQLICAGVATQNSMILGTLVHAEGSAYAVGGSSTATGQFGWGSSKSVFIIRFTVHEPCTVRLAGSAFVYSEPAEILFTGPEGIIWHSGRGSVPGPFDLPLQVLPPGQYTLDAEVIGKSTLAGFSVDMTLDAPIVGVEPTTWGSVKAQYR
jgi:hypothetical protein